MVGNVQQPIKKVGRPSRPNSKRHQIMVDNAVWKWLDSQGASETIERIAREKMEQQARERINGMDFTDEQTEFIFSDWPN